MILISLTTPSSADTAALEQDPALAQLSIPHLALHVPVYPGTSRRTLSRGAGLVPGTARPGEKGNAVVSAHRDKHFKALQYLQQGDLIQLEVNGGAQQYQVEEIFITDPLDLAVLEPTSEQTLTLITCHPFDYVGYAPDRYIVRATRSNVASAAQSQQQNNTPSNR
ncbi:MAG: class D sortase [Pseudomonadales bacterium]